MTPTILLRQEGDAFAAAIPAEIAERMNVHDGDELRLVLTDRGPALIPASADDDAVLSAFDDVMRRYDDTLQRLAQ